MILFRRALRLVDQPTQSEATLATALRDWSAERVDAQAVARLEQRLGAALTTPRSAASECSGPAWFLGLWAASAMIALVLASRQATPRDLAGPAAQAPRGVTRISAIEMASRFGVSPREFVRQEAMDTLQTALRR